MNHGFVLWALRDSNPRPSACKADALNQLSEAPYRLFAGAMVLQIFEPTKY